MVFANSVQGGHIIKRLLIKSCAVYGAAQKGDF